MTDETVSINRWWWMNNQCDQINFQTLSPSSGREKTKVNPLQQQRPDNSHPWRQAPNLWQQSVNYLQNLQRVKYLCTDMNEMNHKLWTDEILTLQKRIRDRSEITQTTTVSKTTQMCTEWPQWPWKVTGNISEWKTSWLHNDHHRSQSCTKQAWLMKTTPLPLAEKGLRQTTKQCQTLERNSPLKKRIAL